MIEILTFRKRMNPEDPYEPDVLQCHSRFRPPTIEVMEYKARKVWPDWDDYPPYQDEITRSFKPNSNRQQYPINRVERRYNMEIKKTREEIEEMAKRFRFNETNTPSINDTPQYHAGFTGYFTSNFNNDNYYKGSKPVNIPYNHYSWTQKSTQNEKKTNSNVNYEITNAATLEASLLREQNEKMRKRIEHLKQKLETQKKENIKILKQIEQTEIDIHKMTENGY